MQTQTNRVTAMWQKLARLLSIVREALTSPGCAATQKQQRSFGEKDAQNKEQVTPAGAEMPLCIFPPSPLRSGEFFLLSFQGIWREVDSELPHA